MKKTVTTLVSAAMLVCMTSATATAAFAADLSACEFKVTADKTVIHPGETVTFTLTVTPTGDLYGISAGFDIPEGLTFRSAALANGLKGSLDWDSLDPPGAAAELFLGVTASKPYTAGKEFVVGTYTCTANENFDGGNVSLTSVAAGNANYDEISNVTFNTVTIKAAELVKVKAKASACNEQGNSEYWKCSDNCGKVYKADKKTPTTEEAEKLPLAAHSYTEEKAEEKCLKTPANCKVAAVYFKSCAVCGEKGTETFTSGDPDKTKHGKTELKNKKEATCADKGYTGDEVCTICGDTVKKGEATAATGKHTGGTATCVKKAVCDTCKQEYGEINPDNHEVELEGAKAPTCTEPGNTGSGTCTACGETVEAKELPALGHKGGTATCNKKAVCDTCKQEYGELDKSNHGDNGTEIKNQKDATETAEGYTGDKVCKGCGEVLEKGKTIPKKTSSSGVGTVTFPSNTPDSTTSAPSDSSGSTSSTVSDSTPSSSDASSSSTVTSKPSSSDDGSNVPGNPSTGIALAFSPVLLAAGAAVIIIKSKKRK